MFVRYVITTMLKIIFIRLGIVLES